MTTRKQERSYTYRRIALEALPALDIGNPLVNHQKIGVDVLAEGDHLRSEIADILALKEDADQASDLGSRCRRAAMVMAVAMFIEEPPLTLR